MVKLRLREDYGNNFLTTAKGNVFYLNPAERNLPKWTDLKDEEIKNDNELVSLIKQQVILRQDSPAPTEKYVFKPIIIKGEKVNSKIREMEKTIITNNLEQKSEIKDLENKIEKEDNVESENKQ